MLMGALAGQRDLAVTLDGSAGLRRRPMKRVAEPLRLMGAELGDTPPLTIHGQALHGIEYTMPVASAQVKAAILFAALQADSRRDPPTRPLARSLRTVTAIIGRICRQWINTVTLTPSGKPLGAIETTIPGDISSAAFVFAAAALVPNSEVTVTNVGVNGRARAAWTHWWRWAAMSSSRMCAKSTANRSPTSPVKSSELRGITINGDLVVRMIDEFPIFAVLASQAHGETVVREAESSRERSRSHRIAGE